MTELSYLVDFFKNYIISFFFFFFLLLGEKQMSLSDNVTEKKLQGVCVVAHASHLMLDGGYSRMLMR